MNPYRDTEGESSTTGPTTWLEKLRARVGPGHFALLCPIGIIAVFGAYRGFAAATIALAAGAAVIGGVLALDAGILMFDDDEKTERTRRAGLALLGLAGLALLALAGAHIAHLTP